MAEPERLRALSAGPGWPHFHCLVLVCTATVQDGVRGPSIGGRGRRPLTQKLGQLFLPRLVSTFSCLIYTLWLYFGQIELCSSLHMVVYFVGWCVLLSQNRYLFSFSFLYCLSVW